MSLIPKPEKLPVSKAFTSTSTPAYSTTEGFAAATLTPEPTPMISESEAQTSNSISDLRR